MSVLTKMASMLSWTRSSEPRAARDASESRRAGRRSRGSSMVHPESPVSVEAPEAADAESSEDAAPSEAEQTAAIERSGPRSKQEMISELQKNYVEVLDLVRKVNAHLDRQEERSDRIMGVVDRLPEAIDSMAAVREQNGALLAAVKESTATAKAGDERVASVVEDLARQGERQAGALTSIDESLEQARKTELQLVQTMAEFRTSVGDMAGSSARMGETLESLHKSNQAREKELVEIVNESRRWTLTAMIGCGAGAAIALSLAMIALMSGGG